MKTLLIVPTILPLVISALTQLPRLKLERGQNTTVVASDEQMVATEC